jgi:hypothetical protein
MSLYPNNWRYFDIGIVSVIVPFEKFEMQFSSVNLVILKMRSGWALVAHACNPSYSGSRHQEDHGLRPVWENSSQAPNSKIPNNKNRLVKWLKWESVQ